MQQNTHLLGGRWQPLSRGWGFVAGLAFMYAGGDLGEGDVGAGDGDGGGGVERMCNGSSPMMQSHVLKSSHFVHIQLPNNLHLSERDQRQHCHFLHRWTVCSTTANRALSNT